jgi:hypothetical protein
LTKAVGSTIIALMRMVGVGLLAAIVVTGCEDSGEKPAPANSGEPGKAEPSKAEPVAKLEAEPSKAEPVAKPKPLPAIAREWERQCEGGETRACYRLALAIEHGGVGGAERDRAALFQQACEPAKDITFGCLHTPDVKPKVIAAMCQGGRRDACDRVIGDKDPREVLAARPALRETFEGACNQGVLALCDAIPTFVGPGKPTTLAKTEVERLPPTASDRAKRLAALCDRQIPAGCAQLGDLYHNKALGARNGMTPNAARSTALGARACHDGTHYGCRLLADIAFEMAGMSFNSAIVRDLRRSCEAANVTACAGLAAGLEATGKTAEAAGIALELCASTGHDGSCKLGRRALAR